jgi:type II secretory pathway pseudopilin PulG
MKYVLLAILASVNISLSAQSLSGSFDVGAYPEVSFVWNEYNPEIKDSTQFILTEDGAKIAISVSLLSYRDTVVRNKSILFLWEDLNHPDRRGQAAFTREVLHRFLQDSTIHTGDRFNVAVFDRKGGNDLGTSIHTLLNDGFTRDAGALAEAVLHYQPRYDFFSKQVNSELYMAMEEGLDLLKQEPADNIRVLVLVTAGSNMDKHGGKGSFEEQKTIDLKIPVYLIKFPIAHCEHCTNIDLITKNTYGQAVETTDVQQAVTHWITAYRNISVRHHGQDYRIAFTAQPPRDGKVHLLTLNVNGKEYTLNYTAPAFSIKVWTKAHLLVAIGIVALMLALAGGVLVLILKARRKRRLKLQEIENEQNAIRLEAESNRQALLDYQQKGEAEKSAEQEARLMRLMETKNLYPRLQCVTGNERTAYTVSKVVTTIGRAEDNDLVLSSSLVSNHHAKLIFNGSGFEIQDLGSTNRVIVNGNFVKQSGLKNADIIGLGETIITFYL